MEGLDRCIQSGGSMYSSHAVTPKEISRRSPSSHEVHSCPHVSCFSIESDSNVSLVNLEETLKQNETLRQEVRSLQYDNVVLLSQLETQIVCLSALTFDAERYKTKLEQEHIEVPASTFDEVRASTKIPTSLIPSGIFLPEDLIKSAQLSPSELASFSSIHKLVNTINDLQVRLREAHLQRSSLADTRLAELHEFVKSIETQLEEAQQSRVNLKKRFEEDLMSMTRKRDAAINRLTLLEKESISLKKQLEKAKLQESVEIEKLHVEELEQKIESLHDLVEKQSNEINALRVENNSLLASSLVSEKENEYHSMAWRREQKINEGLRNERERFSEELNTLKSSFATLQTDLMLTRGKLDLSERMAEARNAEITHWKKRLSDVQQQHSEEVTFWEKNVHNGFSRLSEMELKLEASQERISDLETLLAEKQKAFSEIVAEKDEQIGMLFGRLKQRQVLLDEEVATRASAEKNATNLANALKGEKEERQALVDQIALVQKQAAILKERHPTLNFEVLEKELQDHEHRQRCLVAELNCLKQEKSNLLSILQRAEEKSCELQELLNKSEQSCGEKEAELEETVEKMRQHAENLEKNKETLQNMEKVLEEKDKEINDLQGKLEKELAMFREAHAKVENLSKECEYLKEVHERERKEFQDKLNISLLDASNAQQAHRLEVQAHSNDIRRFNDLNDELTELQEKYDKLTSDEKNNISKLQVKIDTLEGFVKDLRSSLQFSDAEKQLLKSDNDMLRQLMHDKLDSLELEDKDSLKAQLAYQLRGESALKRNLDSVRVENERLKQEVESLRIQMAQIRSQSYEDAQTIEKLEKEKSLSQNYDMTSKGISVRDQEFSLLQLRFNRLSDDYQYQQELRRNSEKQLNDLLADIEPFRRRVAVLQGEKLNLKNALNQAEQDAKLYKQKYFEATRGRETDVEKTKEELSKVLQDAESEKSILKEEKESLLKLYDENVQRVKQLTQENQRLSETLISEQSKIQSLEKALKELESLSHKKHEQNAEQSDSSEIRRKYQLQLTNVQRLLQQTNQEKTSLHTELLELDKKHREQLSINARLQEELTKLQDHMKFKEDSGTNSPRNEYKSSSDDVVARVFMDEIVRLGILSASFLRTLSMNASPMSPSSTLLSQHEPRPGSAKTVSEMSECLTATQISIDLSSTLFETTYHQKISPSDSDGPAQGVENYVKFSGNVPSPFLIRKKLPIHSIASVDYVKKKSEMLMPGDSDKAYTTYDSDYSAVKEFQKMSNEEK